MKEYSDEYPYLADIMFDFTVQTPATARVYENHISDEDAVSGVRTGQFIKGTIRCKGNCWWECYVIYYGADSKRRSVEIIGIGFRCVCANVINFVLN